MASELYFDGQFMDSQHKLVTADNRGLRYGDGLFETMKVINGQVVLANLHMQRLFRGLAQLRFDLPVFFTPEQLLASIMALCRKNKVEKAARIRLNIFRGNGGLYDPEDLSPHVVIQSWPLPEQYLALNTNGLVIDVYPEARKSCDPFANLKSNNFLPYIMAALYAKEQGLNDCLVLNTHNRIADATIANIWYVQGNTIYTPPLSEGGVAGVMRQYLLEKLTANNAIREVVEKPLTVDDLLGADEVFLTNALYGIRWVASFRDKTYPNTMASLLYQHYIKALNS